MGLPIRTGVTVDSLDRTDDGGFVLCAGDDRYEAAQVVVATGGYSEPRIPGLRVRPGPGDHAAALVRVPERRACSSRVASSSSAPATRAARSRTARPGPATRRGSSGRDTGQMPFDIDGRVARMVDLVFWPFIHHVVTIRTPIGRKARPFLQQHGGPLERIRRAELEAVGVKRVVGRTVGVTDGMPLLDDGQVLDVRNVVWATGFRHDYPWIRVPVIGPDGWPIHERGIVGVGAGPRTLSACRSSTRRRHR